VRDSLGGFGPDGTAMRGLALLRRMLGRLRVTCVLFGALTVATAATALAADPGRWVETGRKTTSISYWQGMTFDARARNFYFDGVSTGLYRTTDSLARRGASAT
jgi:hypothetical protein